MQKYDNEIYKWLKDKLFKEPTIYNKNYTYIGSEPIDVFEDERIVAIRWYDGTVTKAKCSLEDKFDIELGILIAVVKKFCRGISISYLYKAINPIYFKEFLQNLVKWAYPKKNLVVEIREFVKEYKILAEHEKAVQRKEQKRIIKKATYFKKKQEMKDAGKWVDEKEIARLEKENQELKDKIENKKTQNDRLILLLKLQKENEELRKQL